MKRLTLYLLIGIWGLALAQAPEDETTPGTDPVAESAAPEEEPATDEPEAVEPDPDFEASVEDVFKPGDEISEDYPIPLPADI